jgi:hypothetical protein
VFKTEESEKKYMFHSFIFAFPSFVLKVTAFLQSEKLGNVEINPIDISLGSASTWKHLIASVSSKKLFIFGVEILSSMPVISFVFQFPLIPILSKSIIINSLKYSYAFNIFPFIKGQVKSESFLFNCNPAQIRIAHLTQCFTTLLIHMKAEKISLHGPISPHTKQVPDCPSCTEIKNNCCSNR